MNFGTEGLKTEERVSGYLTFGINHCKIVSIQVIKAGSTDSKKIRFSMEGVSEGAGFQGVDGAKGKVGRVETSYMSKPETYKDFMRQIGVMADKLGVRVEIDQVKALTIEDYVARVEPILKGKFAWWNFGGEEYSAGKWKLLLLKYGFIKSESEVDPSTIVMDKFAAVQINNAAGVIALRFDKKNKFHYTPFEPSQDDANVPSAADAMNSNLSVDDLPFGIPSNRTDDLPFGND